MPATLSEIGIGEEKFALMASEAVRTSGISKRAYVKLEERDVEAIFRLCR